MASSAFDRIACAVPSEPDVKRLMEAFGDVGPDETIPYEAVESTLRIKRDSSRWRVVTHAWRRRMLRERNVMIVCVAGESFKRLTEQDRSAQDTKEWIDKQRAAMRRVRDMHCVDSTKFSERELNTHTHRQRVLVAVSESIRTTTKEIAPPRAPEQLPKFVPID